MSMVSVDTNKWSILNEYFDKVYIITIPRNENRRQFLNKHLEGLNFEYFYGADGKKLDFDKLEAENAYSKEAFRRNYFYVSKKYINHSPKHEVLPNEIACTLSHKQVYEDIVAKGYEKVLIFEDDVMVVQDNLTYIAAILKELPADWEFLYLGYVMNVDLDFLGSMKKKFISTLYQFNIRPESVSTKYKAYPKRFSKHLMRSGVHLCLEAYAIRQSTAQKFVQAQTPLQWMSDHLPMELCATDQLNAFIAVPRIFTQYRKELGSSIWEY